VQTDPKVQINHRARAIAKLKLELPKDIVQAIDVARKCGLWDFLRLCYLLRLNRMIQLVPELREKMTPADTIAVQLGDESLKYAIALVAKHGNWSSEVPTLTDAAGFDNQRVNTLSELTRYINAKFEAEKLLYVADVTVSGIRDQDATLDIQAGMNDPVRALYMDFGVRVEQSTMRRKDKLLSVEELIQRLHDEYANVAELFESDNQISLSAYCAGIGTLARILREKGTLAEEVCTSADGRIYPQERNTFVAMAGIMIFTDAELQASISPEFLKYLQNHPFAVESQNDDELRFHYLSRRPFFVGNGFTVLSPDLIFDSILDNAHFTLLESEASKQEYMAKKSGQFIDQIASVASAFGYTEVERERDLYEGKNNIGDIDLVLNNNVTGHTLFIEAKNHALPLDVYFVKPDAIDQHINRTSDWEKKVKRRIEHVKAGAQPKPWDYIVVSRMPEPYSHVTDLLVLSLDEFQFWLAQAPRPATFTEVYKAIYKLNLPNISVEQLQELHNGNFLLANFDQKR